MKYYLCYCSSVAKLGLTPRDLVVPDSYSSPRWLYLPISSSAVPFSCCLPSFQTSGSFPTTSRLGAQSIWASAFGISPSEGPARVWFPFGRIDLIGSPRGAKGLAEVFSSNPNSKAVAGRPQRTATVQPPKFHLLSENGCEVSLVPFLRPCLPSSFSETLQLFSWWDGGASQQF